ncbi:hypothetical protein [Mycobacterium sp.]|uniref:hypothetical protein n=1 Tax=Mycobacterium sp. TaxID=1785 RepID=UPI0025DC42A1|nr:hypothetical protein [Mycobacterium sp.]
MSTRMMARQPGVVVTAAAAGLVEQVLAALAGRTFAGRNEVEVQDRVAAALTEAGVGFAREYRLSERGRPDFLVGGQVVVEVKLKTPRSAVVRQLGRYAEHDSVGAIVLASPSFTTLRNMRMTIHGVAVVPAVLHGPGLVI